MRSDRALSRRVTGRGASSLVRRCIAQRRSRSEARVWHVTRWALWRQPARVIATELLVVGLVTTLTVLGLLKSSYQTPTVLRDVLLVALGIGFEEVSRGIARLRTRLVDTGLANMLSVWVFAAAVALPPPHAIAICLALSAHRWIRQPASPGAHTYRRVYSTAVHMLSVGAASAVVHSTSVLETSLLAALPVVALGAASLSLTGRLLVFGMISIAELRLDVKTLIGRWSDYSLEAATVCLGGMTGLTLAVKPPLAVLALLPAYALQRGALVRELEVAASHDPKTGLLNPMAWQTLAKRELSRAQREDQPAAVLIIDLDHFKHVNDRWGHVAGDAVLKAVGHCLREELRDYDSIGRFGGEEFVAILPDVDEFQAAVIADRLRRSVGELRIASVAERTTNPKAAAESDHTLSTSVGVACFPEHGGELDQLLIGADAALYRAKERGRNCVEFADAPGPDPRELIASD